MYLVIWQVMFTSQPVVTFGTADRQIKQCFCKLRQVHKLEQYIHVPAEQLNGTTNLTTWDQTIQHFTCRWRRRRKVHKCRKSSVPIRTNRHHCCSTQVPSLRCCWCGKTLSPSSNVTRLASAWHIHKQR